MYLEDRLEYGVGDRLIEEEEGVGPASASA